jgi:hypothetical protein
MSSNYDEVILIITVHHLIKRITVQTFSLKKSPLHSEENQINERLATRKNQAKHNPS